MNRMIQEAREAACGAVLMSQERAARRGADAAMRVLLTQLLATAGAFTEGRGVVAASVMEDLLRELAYA